MTQPVTSNYSSIYLIMMLLICQAHDIIKTILFSLTFTPRPGSLGLGAVDGSSVDCLYVTASCHQVLQASAAEVCWGRAASGSDISRALQGELGRHLPMK